MSVEVGLYVLYDGRLAHVLAIGEGRSVTLDFPGEGPCPACGKAERVSLLEHSLLFRESVKPVPTLAPVGAPGDEP